MKKHLQRILSLLCVLAMVFGTAALADDLNVEYDVRVITVKWMDGDNYDGIRPDHVDASLGGEKTTLNEGNGWTGSVSVPHSTDNSWTYDSAEGYTAVLSPDDVSVLTYSHPVAAAIPVSGTVTWDDADNASGIRPESVQLILLADNEPYGEPKTAKAPGWKVTWKDLPARKPNSDTDISYTVKQLVDPEGYTTTVSGTEVKNTLQTAALKLSAEVTGAPDDADISGLSLTVDGPDPSMPRKLKWSDLSNGSYNFGTVLPGAYLVRETNADNLAEGYTMDAENSKVCDAVYVKAGETGTLTFKYAYKLPEETEAEEDYDPMANIGALTFEILGPDSRMPIKITYSDFNSNNEYELGDLKPGVYTVVERNAETLVKYYTLTSASVTGMVLNVTQDGTATARLFNQYVPAPTPEPDAEFVDIPVTKTWNDNNNHDGNRPESVTVRLYADGVEVDSHVLTAAEGWKYTFVDKPRYREDNKTEIVYTVNEDAVAMYAVVINGYNVVNNYQPELTSISVSKIWDDNNNAAGVRPESIAMTLSDGQKVVTTVILNADNNWTATVSDLPTVVNGVAAQYAWKEQSVINYTNTSVTQEGHLMTFTNSIVEKKEEPPVGRKPKTPGDTWYTFEDYDTPLGVEIVINHVGDCFD